MIISSSVYAIPSNNQSKQAFDNKIVKKIKVDNIYNYVYQLSEVIGPRGAGNGGSNSEVVTTRNKEMSRLLPTCILPSYFEFFKI
jgi:hypothetical protein